MKVMLLRSWLALLPTTLLGAPAVTSLPRLRLELHDLSLRAVLVNPSAQAQAYLLSDKLQPVELRITDAEGRVIAGDDLRKDPDFDRAAKPPALQSLPGGTEVVIKESGFLLPVREVGSSYRFFWRPFAYPPLAPGKYRIQATWTSTHGFQGTIRSDVIEIELPAPSPAEPEGVWCEPIPSDDTSLSPRDYGEPMDEGCVVRAPLAPVQARRLATGEKINLPGPVTQAHIDSLALAPGIQRLYLGPARQPLSLIPLARLGSLRELTIDVRHLRELGEAGELPSLRRLVIDGCPADLDGLGRLTGLEEISLLRPSYGCADVLRSLEGVRGLTALKRLAIADGSSRDARPAATGRAVSLDPLAGLDHLEVLDLSGVHTDDAAPALGKLVGLRVLVIVGLTDLAPLAAASRLEDLTLLPSHAGRGVAIDLSPVAGLPRLRRLILQDQRVTSFAPLARARALAELDLSADCERDLLPLASVSTLKTIHVFAGRVRDRDLLRRKRADLEIRDQGKQVRCPW